jgi:hypothetical protein
MMPATLADSRHGAIYPEQRLWCAVIHRALMDAFMRDDDPQGPPSGMVRSYGLQRQEVARMRDEAIVWLLMDTEGFYRTCDLAGLDWYAVRERARRLIERGDATAIPTGGLADAASTEDPDVRPVPGDGGLRGGSVPAASSGCATAAVVLPGTLGADAGGPGTDSGPDEGSNGGN